VIAPADAGLAAIGWPDDPAAYAAGWAEALAAHPAALPARVSEQHRSG
jgi:ribosome biogenesis GTPase / thiamine phosphate phosphatase